MEETRSIQMVGGYSVYQASPDDCIECHDAKYGTILVDGKCLDCRDKDLKLLVDKQAEDGGLWFHAETAPEAYLQQELRKLHSMIET